MKSLAFAVSLLNVASAMSPDIRPYEVRPVNPNATGLEHRIYGGTEAKEGQFPFMVFVMMNLQASGYAKCSSSLISSKWVLVAAHCLFFPSLRPEDLLLVGKKANLRSYINARIYETTFYEPMDETYWGVQERRAEEFFIHPHYSTKTYEHDVGLIRVKRPFVLGDVQTIPVSRNKIFAPKVCTVLGWGLTRGNVDTYKLNYIEKKRASTVKIWCKYKISGAFICLEQDGTGICKGDSGGPLVCDGEVWGVASHYVTEPFKTDCGDSLEEYYAEIYEDVNWIRQKTEGGGGGAVAVGTSLKTVLLCLVLAWLSGER